MKCKTFTGWLRAAASAMLLLCAASGPAMGEIYRITTYAAGEEGTFSLDGAFDLPGPDTTGPYELRVTTEFDEPLIFDDDPERVEILAFDVALTLELTVGGTRYTKVQDNAWLSLDLSSDRAGVPLNDMRYTINFTPTSSGNGATLVQSFLVPPGLLGLSDLLRPVSLSTPDITDAAFSADTFFQNEEVIIFLGSASGSNSTFTYQVAVVPEPATHAMLLLGCAVVACAARRRAAL